jgi:glutamate dehydrogenase
MLGNVPAERLKIIEGIAARAGKLAKRSSPVDAGDLARAYYHGVSETDLATRTTDNLAGAALAHLQVARTRQAGEAIVRVFNPDLKRDGFASEHTVIALATDDMPFLVDSIGIVFTQGGYKVYFIAIHTAASSSITWIMRRRPQGPNRGN